MTRVPTRVPARTPVRAPWWRPRTLRRRLVFGVTSLVTVVLLAVGVLSATPKPTISGTAKVGKKLTAKAGTWKPSGVKLKYQWYRGSKKISGATKKTYTLTSADKGKKITVKVTGTKPGYTTVSKTSVASGKVAAGVLTTVKPKITGTVKVGKKLTAKPGTWKPSGVKLSYQWLRNGKAIKGATKSTFVPRSADKGKTVEVLAEYVPTSMEAAALYGMAPCGVAPSLGGTATMTKGFGQQYYTNVFDASADWSMPEGASVKLYLTAGGKVTTTQTDSPLTEAVLIASPRSVVSSGAAYVGLSLR